MSNSSQPTTHTAFLSLTKSEHGDLSALSETAEQDANSAGRNLTGHIGELEETPNRHASDAITAAVDAAAEKTGANTNTNTNTNTKAMSDGGVAVSAADPLTSRVLWLAVYFPRLAIEMPLASHEAVSNNDSPSHCLVAVEKVQGRSLIQSVSDRAAEYGICVGMNMNAAYSLCAGLQVRCYDELKQRRYLERIAAWAMRFSSQVSVADTTTLLLEIKGSLRYYGGMTALLQTFQQQLRDYHAHTIQLAVAPTAAASLLLAKTQSQNIVLNDYRHLRSVLSDVHINDLPLSRKLKQQLRRLGLRRLQDLWRLPRQDLSRRYGEALVVYLDALIGMNSEMLDYYRLPDHFTCQWHLDYETKDATVLTRIVKNLLEKLEEYLIQCDYHIHGYCVELVSVKKKPYVINIGLRKPGRQLSHLLNLFEEQLKRVAIGDKIASVKLHSRDLVKAAVRSDTLAFSPEFVQAQGDAGIEIDELLDLIQARLGNTAIKSIHAMADHRPEFAGMTLSVRQEALRQKSLKPESTRQASTKPASTRQASSKPASRNGKENGIEQRVRQPVSSTLDAQCWKQRPLWLLPDPYPLRTQQRQPVYGDVLQLVEGPERIEAAWWSDADVRRDYYYALTPNGQRLWIYQELNAPYKWYLHGFFA